MFVRVKKSDKVIAMLVVFEKNLIRAICARELRGGSLYTEKKSRFYNEAVLSKIF